MRNLSAKIACGLLAISLVTASLSGCGKSALDGSEEAIVIDGESVNVGTANFLLRFQQASMLSYYAMFGQSAGSIFSTATENGTYGDSFKSDILGSIEKMYLIRSHAGEYDVSLSQEELDGADAAAEKFLDSNDKKVLEKLGVTKKDISEVLQLYAYQAKVSAAAQAGMEVEVSDEEAAQTSITSVMVSTTGTEKDKDGNVKELTDKEKEEKKKLAQDVLDKVIASGDTAAADMDVLAKEVDESLSAATRSYGSDDTSTDEVLKTAAAKLKDGELNPEVLEGTDGNGYYVLRLDKTFDEEKTASKKEQLVQSKKQEQWNALLDEWLKKAETKNTKAWDRLKVTDKDVYTFKQAETTDSGTNSSSTGSSSTSSSSTGSSSVSSSSTDSSSASSTSADSSSQEESK